jgi:aspartyl-tRNA(Asn)/glutamyl-tRNA(Gln) amidotransferase subunit A
MSDDRLFMTACDLGRGIGAGQIDPRDLTEAFLDAAAMHPDVARIYARMTPKRARAEADAAATRASDGVRRGLLDGVPISWKDLYDTAGVATEAGSAMLAGRTPTADAQVLGRATRAGMVCLGKTHMTELAFSGLGVNPVTATSPNRNDPDWAPGGSSSGAAASVAAGLAVAGIGSDTGGSVRIPSAWNDLVGLKTTAGWLPVTGSVPLSALLDTVGPLCRSVEDAAAITAVLAGAKAPDLTGVSLVGRRFAIDRASMLKDARDEPAAAFEAAVAKLSAAGAVIEHVDFPEFAACLPLWFPLVAGEAWAEWGETIDVRGDLMFHQVRTRFAAGRDVTAAQYLRARAELERLRASTVARMAGYDAVLAPTAPILPPSVSRLLSDDAYFTTENLLALRNTRIGNLLGLCALTLPTGTPSCGLMLLGAPMTDWALCRTGVAAEVALG